MNMQSTGYAGQFATNKDGFLRSEVLRDWEQAALGSFGAMAEIRQNLGIFFVLLALNAGFRLVFMGSASRDLQSAMITDLGGFVIVGTLGAITYFVPRWWMVLLTAIAIFPFALGIITGLMAIAFFCTISSLKRANEELYLSNDQFGDIKQYLSRVADGREDEAWTQLGTVGKSSVRSRFFNNAVVIVSGKKPWNSMSAAEASQCVVEIDKKGRNLLKKWVVRGKLKNTNLMFSDDGLTRWKDWLVEAGSGVPVS